MFIAQTPSETCFDDDAQLHLTQVMNSLPALFVSHGAPDLPIRDGAVTHFLKSLHRQFPKPQAILVVSAHWKRIAEGNWEAVLNYRKIAPHAEKNHPTDEHLLPLFVALGAGGDEVQGVRLHHSYNYGAFSMAANAFTESPVRS